jgi:GNAT superfamily N-acetyltransferase
MTSDEFDIRRAGPADVDAIVDTRVALFRELGSGLDAARETEFRRACAASLERGFRERHAHVWLAIVRGTVRGAAILLVYPRIPGPANLGAEEGYLLNVYVAPECRRRGAATALVAAAVREARERGLARVRLHTTAPGRPVYASLGFEPRDNEMELVLSGAAR